MSGFSLVGNDRALDFVDTAFAGGDTLPTFGAFADWLVATDMLAADEAHAAVARATPAEQDHTLARAHALRSAMRRIVEAYVAGQAPPPVALEVVNAHLQRTPVRYELVATSDGFTSARRVATDKPDDLLYLVAEAARALFTSKNPGSIRRCASEDCTHYFYDASKNGTRRWCSMAGCGNREKVAALRSRRRAG